MTSPEQELAAKYVAEERLFDAKRELLKVDKELLTLEEEKLIEKATSCEAFITAAKGEVDPSWVNLGETKKNGRGFTTHYNLGFQPVRVDFMIETVVEKSLVFPLIATMNEIDLFPSWMPNWSTPKFQVVRAETLERSGNTSQIFTVRTISPLATVEFYVDAKGVDDTATSKELLIHLDPLEPGDNDDMVPPPVEGINRVTLGGGLTFRKCPEDRAELARKLKGKKLKEGEEFVLVNFSSVYQNKTKFLKPGFLVKKLSSFVLKVVTSSLWQKLVAVAEEIREGKRPEFDKVIEEKAATYDWLKNCIDAIVA